MSFLDRFLSLLIMGDSQKPTRFPKSVKAYFILVVGFLGLAVALLVHSSIQVSIEIERTRQLIDDINQMVSEFRARSENPESEITANTQAFQNYEHVPLFDGEDPDEDLKIDAALVEQGYYRNDVPMSYELQEALHTACEEFGVEYALALAVIERETNFTNATGDGGESIGFFQVQKRWWSVLMDEIGVDDLADPEQNFRTGCAILAQLIDRYGNETDALTAYNSGRPGESKYAASVLEAAERWAQ